LESFNKVCHSFEGVDLLNRALRQGPDGVKALAKVLSMASPEIEHVLKIGFCDGGPLHRLVDVAPDPARCFDIAPGEFAHFIRHDREACSAFLGTRCLDRGVEGQKVGLHGNAADHGDNFRHFSPRGSNLDKAVEGCPEHGLSFNGARFRPFGHARKLFWIVADLLAIGLTQIQVADDRLRAVPD
jgi:hypothetical protein